MSNNDFINNMDELQAEHLAEKQAKEAQERAEQEAEWERQRLERNKIEAVARAKRNAERSITLRKIAEQVVQQKHKAEVIEEDAKLIIDGIDTQWRLDFVQERSHQSSWRSTPTGRTRLTVRDYGSRYGSRVSFPQRKDGSHNYVEIARLLINYADRQNHEAALKKQQQANAKILPDLVRELFPNDKDNYQDVIRASGSATLPVTFNFKINHVMSVENARKVAAALRACGIKLHYSDK